MTHICRRLAIFVFGLMCAFADVCGSAEESVEQRYAARDSLQALTDPRADAQACLTGLAFEAEPFEVRCRDIPNRSYRSRVQFPSPLATGDATNDQVSMHWYAATDADGRPITAPAVVVVHESGSQMAVGRLFARGFQAAGFHAFQLHLPYYGDRRTRERGPDSAEFLLLVRQSVADIRRAYDAVRVLPHVDTQRIALQGTSLGGFVAATAGALDNCYQAVFIMLAGGDLYDLISHGQKDTAKVRQRLEEEGYAGEKLKQLLWQIEPTRIAHRLNPMRTWLYSANQDQVVPLANAKALAATAGLSPEHHVRVSANHYTAILFFPTMLGHVTQRVRQL